jgi:hypothetical protein
MSPRRDHGNPGKLVERARPRKWGSTIPAQLREALPRTWQTRTAITATVVMLAAALAALGISHFTQASAQAWSESHPCTKTMSAKQCAQAKRLYLPPGASAQGGSPVEAPQGGQQTSPYADSIPCGADFLSSTVIGRLNERFGSIDCFRLVHEDSWIIVGDGISTTAIPEQITPGGPIVAVGTCSKTDAACLDPDIRHSLSGFVFSRPPNPSGSLHLQASFGEHILVFYNCGPFAFSVSTLRWYDGRISSVDSLLTQPSSVSPLPTQRLLHATTALQSPHPPASSSSCTQ